MPLNNRPDDGTTSPSWCETVLVLILDARPDVIDCRGEDTVVTGALDDCRSGGVTLTAEEEGAGDGPSLNAGRTYAALPIENVETRAGSEAGICR